MKRLERPVHASMYDHEGQADPNSSFLVAIPHPYPDVQRAVYLPLFHACDIFVMSNPVLLSIVAA